MNGALAISRQTNVIIRPGDIINAVTVKSSLIYVTGSFSGKHSGTLKLSDDKKTLVFTPYYSFTYSERVTVKLLDGIKTTAGQSVPGYSFYFTIQSQPKWGKTGLQSIDNESDDPVHPSPWQNPTKVESVMPTFTPTIIDNPMKGSIFVAPWFSGQPAPDSSYLAIINDSGRVLWSRSSGSRLFDFKLNPNGLMTYHDVATAKYYAMDSTFRIVDSFACGNGKWADLHDIELLPNGHTLLMAYDTQNKVDLSYIEGGLSDAAVIGVVLQELDLEKNVVFNWRSLDSGGFTISDMTNYRQLVVGKPYIDEVHSNSLQVDTDGNILLSNRHLDEITKISRTTGKIVWRWGGYNNQFTFIGDTTHFSYQHHVRRNPNGRITVFDNGNLRDTSVAKFTRASEYELDENAKTARLTWQFSDQKRDTSGFMGSVQYLDADRFFIGWGGNNLGTNSSHGPSITEVRRDGSIALQMNISFPYISYRAFKYDWTPSSGAQFAVPHYGSDIAPRASLSEPYPNPSNGLTHLTINLPHDMVVDLRVYDVLGHEIATVARGWMIAGPHEIPFDCTTLSNGLYHCVLRVDGAAIAKEIVIQK
jgi:hypothetical protein